MHHFCLPRRLRRRSDQPLSRLRDADRDEGRAAAEARRQGSRQALHQVDRQGPAQGDVQDGHLDLPVLLRRADLRRRRPAKPTSSPASSPAPRPASKASASPRSPRRRCAAIAIAFGDSPVYRAMLDVGGEYAFRMRGEEHVWTPTTVAPLQHAVRGNSMTKYAPFAKLLNEQSSACSPSAACSASRRPRRTGASRSRSRRSSRPSEIVQALRDRRHVASARSRARRTPRSPSP